MIPNPWLIVGVVVTHLAVPAGAFSFGRSHEAGEQAKVQLDQALAYAGEIVARQASIDDIADHLEKVRKVAAQKNRIITKEVIRYETVVPADLRCDLPGAWRVRHDAAATGEPVDPGAAGLADGGAAPVGDAAALEVVADNYADCRGYAEQVKGWQAYYREIRAQAGGSKPPQDAPQF